MGLEALRENPASWVQLYRAVVRLLQEDPTLQGCDLTWRVFAGETSDADAAAEQQLPWVRVNPPPLHIQDLGVNYYDVQVPLRIEIVTPGLDYDDHGNLWGAIVDALAGDKALEGVATVEGELRSVSCYFHVLRDATEPVAAAGNLRSSAVLEFRVDQAVS